ncbi:hypothetical protein WA158_005618 [Blastocystis sp. Blastoise]
MYAISFGSSLSETQINTNPSPSSTTSVTVKNSEASFLTRVSWLLYGSKDNDNYILLDHHDSAGFSITELDFINSYKYISRENSSILPLGLIYPRWEYEFLLNYQKIYISPISSGYSNYTYNSTIPLPTTVVFHPNTGIFESPILTVSIYVNINVTAIDAFGIESYASFTIKYYACSYPYYPINVVWYSGIDGYKENYELSAIQNDVYKVLFTSSLSENNKLEKNMICIYKTAFRISANNIYNDLYNDNVNKIWGKRSYIRMDTVYDTPLYYFNQYYSNKKYYELQVDYIFYDLTEFKYYTTQNHVTNWYQPSFNDNSWIIASSAEFPTVIPYSTTTSIFYYRYTYSFASVNDIVALNVLLYNKYGLVFYINSKEQYRIRIEEPVKYQFKGIQPLSEPIWEKLTLGTTSLSLGVNHFSIGIYIPDNAKMDHSFSMRMFSQKGDCSPRSLNVNIYTNIPNTNYIPGNLVDMDWSTKYQSHRFDTFSTYTTNENSSSSVYADNTQTTSIIYQFTDRREYFNKYTVISANDFYASDPVSWVIYASVDGYEWDYITNVKKNSFSERNIDNSYYIHNIQQSYSYLKFDFQLETGESFQLAELNLYSCPYISSISLSYPQTSYSLIKGVNMSPTVPTSDYFHEFTVTPVLPRGLTLDSANGRITGIPTSVSPANTIYIIQAKDILNQAYSTSMYIIVEDCIEPNKLLTLSVIIEEGGEDIGFTLSVIFDNSTTSVVHEETSLPSFYTSVYGFCRAAARYKLTLFDNSGLGWSANSYIKILSGSSTLLVKDNMQVYGGISKEIYFTTIFYLEPGEDYKMLTGSKTYPSSWNNIIYTDSQWSTSSSSSVLPITSITSYIRKVFYIYSLQDNYYLYEILMKTNYGCVIYLNGNELMRYKLPMSTLTLTTLSSVTSTEWISYSGSAQFSDIQVGNNIIAIELHSSKSSNYPILDFDLLLLLPTYTNYPLDLNRGTASSNTREYSRIYSPEHIFDISLYTSYYSLEWDYSTSYILYDLGEKQRIYMNKYTIQIGQNTITNYPSSWTIYGSNNNVDWTLVDTRVEQYFTSRYQSLTYSVPNIYSYRYFKFYFTSNQNHSDSTIFELVGIQFFAERITCYCPENDNFESVPCGMYAYSTCPTGMEGKSKAFCDSSMGIFTNMDITGCILQPPSLLSYDISKVITFYKGIPIDPLIPQVTGIVDSYTFPLAKYYGLLFDSTTGIISGTPTDAFTGIYTIQVKAINNAGTSNSFSISFSIVYPKCREYDNWSSTDIGSTVYRICPDNSLNVQERMCITNEQGLPEWGPITGYCKEETSITVYVVN